ICLGLQCMVIEYARNVLGLEQASSTEFDPATPDPVVATMAEQVHFVEGGGGDMGGTMRLGSYEAVLEEGSLVAEVYGATRVTERHRHRYEVNNTYRDALAEAGLHISGRSPDSSLVEFVELDRARHPYYVATQAHPEFKSRPTAAHPLFRGLIGAALERQRAGRLLEVEADALAEAPEHDTRRTTDLAEEMPASGAAERQRRWRTGATTAARSSVAGCSTPAGSSTSSGRTSASLPTTRRRCCGSSSTTPARSRSSPCARDPRARRSSSSTSTATRCGLCCGRSRPACSTSQGRTT